MQLCQAAAMLTASVASAIISADQVSPTCGSTASWQMSCLSRMLATSVDGKAAVFLRPTA